MEKFKAAGGTETVKTASTRQGRPRPGEVEEAARRRAAVETYARNETALRRSARRFSLCEDDVDDALQRGLEILLRKAPTLEPRELVRWTQTVVKHEALAIRRERERILGAPSAPAAGEAREDWVALLPCAAEGPAEKVEQREAIARSREALQTLKPQELRALTLLAHGYSYAEIGEITSWSRTKINRCLAEGRERFRRVVSSSEDGSRCAEMRPLLSAFCDGEADGDELDRLREHLRACGYCRATLRTYRATAPAASALVPALFLQRSLFERIHDAILGLGGRLGAGRTDAAAQAASGGGAGGMGAAALAKIAVLCIGTAAGGTACVATGLVPTALEPGGQPAQPAQLERAGEPTEPVSTVDYEPAPEPAAPPAKPKPKRHPHPHPAESASEATAAPAEAAPAESEISPSSGGAEYAPPAEAVAEPAPSADSGGGNPAGEFGP
jgi:RNA polymerase sigma factor (sigma-70 family)